LVRDFASRTLDGVLGEARAQLASDVGTQVQQDLDALNSGVEILATVIEAIHPPAAAANAYHSVQAAQIGAQAIIARERGKAAEQVNTAQLRATVASAQADAAARETVATAEAAQLRFAAERDAYGTAGKAFLFEQYLAQLTQGLANAQLVIIDHRLRTAAPTIDLRQFGAPADTNVRRAGQ
jgi:regulator of protease activity HflC (stomatin/prohibitin superfamily)